MGATNWISGWTAAQPMNAGFALVGADEVQWVSGDQPGVSYRDLGAADTTGGLMGTRHVRATPGETGAKTDWLAHNLDFHVIVGLGGTVTLDTEDGQRHALGFGDTVVMPALYRYRLELSGDAEYFDVRFPAEPETITGRDAPLPQRAAELDPDRKPFISQETPENYVTGAGPRKFFAYRGLQTQELTEGRILAQFIRVVEGGVPTAWHYHTMGQFAVILGGSATLLLTDHSPVKLTRGTGLCIGAGIRHDVRDTSEDYTALEFCIPAEYDTVTIDPPAESVHAS